MKLTGCQYYPKRNVAELTLRMMPLQLQNDIHIIKFMLKGLNGADNFSILLL